MISKTEIRIGNWVECYNHRFRIGALYSEAAQNETFEGEYVYANIIPIPLSPEILDKVGFSHHKRQINFGDSGYDPMEFWYIREGVDEFGQRKMLHGFIIGEFKDAFYYQSNGRRNKGIKVESLHQLQNLYFALTGEELEVKGI